MEVALVFFVFNRGAPLQPRPVVATAAYHIERVDYLVFDRIITGYALTESFTGEVLFYFEEDPVEWRFEDVNVDSIDDLVYVIPAQWGAEIGTVRGFVEKVALGMGDGHFSMITNVIKKYNGAA